MLIYKTQKEIMESEKCVKNMLNAIRTLGLHDFVRDFDNEQGFMWSNDQRIYDIGEKVMSDGHSGASFACCLRRCQQWLKNNPYDVLGVDSEHDGDADADANADAIANANTDANANALEPETKSEYIEGTDVKNGAGEDYVFYEGMDTYNKQAMDIAVSKGMDAAVEFMTKGLSDGTSCYAAMRERYG